jgi:DNA-binding XRE family transcriptional regulator
MRTKLLEKRKKMNMTQAQVADAAGISRSFYTNIENGIKTPSFKTAQKIAVVLKIKTVDELNDIFFDLKYRKREQIISAIS